MWKPSVAGLYAIIVEIKDESGQVVTKKVLYSIQNVLQVTSLKTNVLSPQEIGTGITISATGIGNETLQYKFAVKFGTKIVILQDYSKVNSVVWNPKEAGLYSIMVIIKDASNQVATEEYKYIINPEVTINSYTASVPSPQTVGNTIKLSTSSSGGIGTIETKYAIYDGINWMILKAYSTDSSVTWTPIKAGIYKINATVKDATGHTVTKEYNYIITINDFTESVASPHKVGSLVNFSSSSSGTVISQQKTFVINA